MEAVIFAVPHKSYLDLNPDDVVSWAGNSVAVIDCFGILPDETIRRYFELGCEVKALGRGHVQRIKKEVQKQKVIPQGTLLHNCITVIHLQGSPCTGVHLFSVFTIYQLIGRFFDLGAHPLLPDCR